ncbi:MULTISPECIES: ABC transporter permease [unclassified Breznakia]|uniref:ABC transporter permease n=1 Tax=unclassified Breznakia TaxID=2623764 RepID=UPI002406704D|nr:MULTISPECIES: ABC transporter permease [unclassified Breznakia]MDF9838066.1 ABC-2 type transport system permease protein [Breznakia sp. PFB2-8]MDF9860052.1 ABC-2 type transport system permease protein [Breznakia sp. PH5-24]
MFNLIKADLYRLFKTKSYYVVGAILVFFILTLMYSLGDMINSGITTEQFDYGFDIHNPQLIDLLYNVFMNTVLPMIIGIGAAMYVCTDYSSGYIKNIASSVNNKATIALSKFITMIIGVTIYFILMILLTYILGTLFIGNVDIGDVGAILQYTGMSLFLNLVIIALVILAASFLRSSAATITLIVVVVMTAQLGYQALDQFLGLDLAEYSPVMNIGLLTPANTELWGTMLISGAVFMAIYIAGSLVAMEKKDIT